MKVFISQPMRGKTTNQIKLDRQAIIDKVTSLGHTVIDSVIYDSYYNDIYMLAKSIQLMSFADIVVFMDGWSKSRGCKVERQVAEDYGLQILEQNELNKLSSNETFNEDIKYKYDI